MPIRVGSDSSALSAQRNIGVAERQIEHSLRALASGQRIVQPGDDSAGLAISENLRGQVSGLRQARSNAENAVSVIQVAEGGLNEQNNILIRLRELGVQAASDTVGDEERQYIDQEFQQLSQEIDRIAKTTQFGHKKLLMGDPKDYVFHVGPNAGSENMIRYKMDADTTAAALDINGLSVGDKDDAADSLSSIDEALSKIASVRANFGAMQSRLLSSQNNLDIQLENVTAARSRIADVDVADETSSLIAARVRSSVATAVIAQTANMDHRAERLISLLG